jgi:GGDEF domain-containing protein
MLMVDPMPSPFAVENYLPARAFLNQAGIEIVRAERYRTFVSLVSLDLSFARSHFNGRSAAAFEKIRQTIQKNVRASDHFAFINDNVVVILFPETSRQDAEVTARRISDIILRELASLSGNGFEKVIPLEMASFPDTAGARTVSDLLGSLADRASQS